MSDERGGFGRGRGRGRGRGDRGRGRGRGRGGGGRDENVWVSSVLISYYHLISNDMRLYFTINSC